MNGDITSIIGSIRNAGLPMYIASMIEDFVKVWAEYKYDALAKTKYFQKLKSMEKQNKLLIVAAMFAINGHLKIKLTENTPSSLFLKGLLTDFFPEMGKRLINGENSPDPEEQEVIEIITKTDGSGETHYEPKDPAPSAGAAKERRPKEPGFCAGFFSTFEDRMKDTVEKKKGGQQ